jgi:hypothetical protein
MRTAACFRTAIFLCAFCCAAPPALRAQTPQSASGAPAPPAPAAAVATKEVAANALPENPHPLLALASDARDNLTATSANFAAFAPDAPAKDATIVAAAAPIVIVPPPVDTDIVRSHGDARRIEVHPRLGRTFVALWLANAALTVTSIELTENCVQQPRFCQEKNPLFGNRPGRAELYGFKGGILSGQFLLARFWKLHDNHAWKFATSASLAVNTLDASWDAYATASHSPSRPLSH